MVDEFPRIQEPDKEGKKGKDNKRVKSRSALKTLILDANPSSIPGPHVGLLPGPGQKVIWRHFRRLYVTLNGGA